MVALFVLFFNLPHIENSYLMSTNSYAQNYQPISQAYQLYFYIHDGHESTAIFGFIFPKVHGQDGVFNESVIWPEFKTDWAILLPSRINYALFQNVSPMFQSQTFRNGTPWIPHTHAPGAPNPRYLSHGLCGFPCMAPQGLATVGWGMAVPDGDIATSWWFSASNLHFVYNDGIVDSYPKLRISVNVSIVQAGNDWAVLPPAVTIEGASYSNMTVDGTQTYDIYLGSIIGPHDILSILLISAIFFTILLPISLKRRMRKMVQTRKAPLSLDHKH